MSKRISPEEKVIAFFTTASIDAASAVFNVVKGTMKARIEREGQAARVVAPTDKSKKVYRKRRGKKTEVAPVNTTPTVIEAVNA